MTPSSQARWIAAAEAGANVELFDIRALDLPLFRPGMGEAPAAARRWAEAACEASGHLWSSPLYQGTISGSFKNALDWLECDYSSARV